VRGFLGGGPARGFLSQISYIALAFVISGVVVALAGKDPFSAMAALAGGAFGTLHGFLTVWTKTCPLLLTGLAVLLAFRVGFWNIGAEGQFAVGAIVAGWIGTWSGIPPLVHIPLVLVMAFAAGSSWCLLAAFLKIRRGALEVISTIMLNFVALFILSWLVHGPLMQDSHAQPIGNPVSEGARLPRLFGASHTVHAGILIAIAAALCGHFFLRFTESGFRLRMVGENPNACTWAGISIDRTVFLAAALSGGIAALAGALEILGVLGRLFDKVSPGYGFTGIAVALLARLEPLALVPAGFFFGALIAGSSQLQVEADVSYVLVLVIQGVVILASAAPAVSLFKRDA
jgi:simple sugar transport system permease protein